MDWKQIDNIINLLTASYPKEIKMPILDQTVWLIERAAAKAGSQNKLAKLIGEASQNLTQMKQGKRPCNWRVRGKLRAILGEDPAAAFMAAMAEDLAESDNADEKKAAQQMAAMLAAFEDGGNGRFRPLNFHFPAPLRALGRSVHGALGRRIRHAILDGQRLVRGTAPQVLSH